MRILTVVSILALTVTVSAQQRSGRHFHRESRLPSTAAKSEVVEATTKVHVKPIKKLRSGRAWPRYHFSRLPAAKALVPATSKPAVVDAAATKPAKPTKPTVVRRGFWGPRK
jgi:hypothetical protein